MSWWTSSPAPTRSTDYLLLQKGDPLVSSLDKAITAPESDDTLKRIQTKWLGIYKKIPTIKP